MKNSKRRSTGRPSAGNYDENDFLSGSRSQAPYEPSDSEDEYTQQEKMLLDKARSSSSRGKQVKKMAVMDLPLYEDNDDDDEDDEEDEGEEEEEEDVNMDSDIEGKEDDFDLPDQRAWGKTRKNFYNTDYVDQDYGGFDGDDAEIAELEEKEAREIQKRLAAELDDNDFTLDVFTKTKDEDEPTSTSEEIIKTDLSQLSSRQKLALLEKEAPELIGIIEEFRGLMEELQQRLQPALALVQNKQVSSPQLAQYIRTKYHLVNNYVMNMGFYLLLRAQRLPVAAHPVVKRLLQYRQLLQQLEPLEEVASTQLDDLLNAANSGSLPVATDSGSDSKKKKKLRLLSLSKAPEPDTIGLDSTKLDETPDPKPSNGLSLKKGAKKSDDKMPWENDFESNGDVPWTTGNGSDSDDGNKIMEGEGEELDGDEDAEGKRAITWQMATNKGLIHRRKKEDRNPRLKNRKKYRKAQIRIKGQIRQPRTEVQRYGGEVTGIKKTVSKSIKIK